MKLRIFTTLLLTLLPTLAFARPHGTSSHMRPQLFRDHTPKARVHSPRPHFNR